MKGASQGSELKRAEPKSEPSSSPVPRTYVVGAGHATGGRSGPKRRPSARAGLSKAHISAHGRQGTMTYYRIVKRYVAKKEEIPELEHKPGQFWGMVGRKNGAQAQAMGSVLNGA